MRGSRREMCCWDKGRGTHGVISRRLVGLCCSGTRKCQRCRSSPRAGKEGSPPADAAVRCCHPQGSCTARCSPFGSRSLHCTAFPPAQMEPCSFFVSELHGETLGHDLVLPLLPLCSPTIPSFCLQPSWHLSHLQL